MTDNFIYSFCKVGFLCYQNEPNWLGIIILVCFGFIIIVLISAIFNIVTEVIGNLIGSKSDREEANREKQLKKIKEIDAAILRKEELKKAKKLELEQLSLIQKIIRIIFLPFVWIRDIFVFTLGIIWIIIGTIIGIGIFISIIYGIFLGIMGIFNYIL